jgi:D-alanine--D-alanine ligase
MRYKVAVLRGGPSSEYEISLKTGKSVIESLKNKHQILDIVIDMHGDWYYNGIPVTPAEVLSGVDVVFNAMHGEFGEDGKVQQILEQINVPFTGPKAFSAVQTIRKDYSRKIFEDLGLKVPLAAVVEKTYDIEKVAYEVFRKMPMPLILKPLDKGSSLGIKVVKDFRDLVDALSALFVHTDRVLVEEYIKGKEATVGVIENFRDQELYPLFPTEIVLPEGKDIFDYDAKMNAQIKNICPGCFSRQESKALQRAAVAAHRGLGLRHYSRSDFIVHPKRGVFILETNALPALGENALICKALGACGSNYDDFVDHIIELATKRK